MTVKELIEVLQTLEPDKKIKVSYTGGEIRCIKDIKNVLGYYYLIDTTKTKSKKSV
jgi:organic radical activating enzyme